MSWFPSRTGDNIVAFEDGRMLTGWNSKHLTTPTRPMQILSRNLRYTIDWAHPLRKGRALR